ncbi:MAG: hypothetical protein LBS17_06270 [Actinomycetes bacterium]|nr:hypothetical protein [Actinomycetes bacterium]
MAHWLFSYNVPLVMNYFFYVCMILMCVFGVATGVYAAKRMRRAEQYIPAEGAAPIVKVKKSKKGDDAED